MCFKYKGLVGSTFAYVSLFLSKGWIFIYFIYFAVETIVGNVLFSWKFENTFMIF